MDAHAMRLAEFVIAGAARMSALIDDLLSFASAGVREPLRSIDLRDATAQAIQNLTPAIEASGAVLTVDRMPIVQGNEIHLVRLFQNLIGNAVKYRSELPVEVHITADERGPDWVIGIADNGRGIAPENQARVFLPFIRLANGDVPGSGLGLAVCQRIVEDLGGTIWVQSLPGAGSTFFFTIAAMQAETFVPRVAHGVSCGAGG